MWDETKDPYIFSKTLQPSVVLPYVLNWVWWFVLRHEEVFPPYVFDRVWWFVQRNEEACTICVG